MNPNTSPPANPARKPGWLSHPLLSLLLGASWLALSHSLEPVHLLSAVWAFMALTLAMAVLASPVKRYTDAAAVQLADQANYARAVLGVTGTSPAPTTRPYDGQRPPAAAPTEETR